MVDDGFLTEDAKYAISTVLPEVAKNFEQYSKEYRGPRILGIRAEFVELHRKLGKIKLAVWDGVDTSEWRESPRTILLELIATACLAVKDLDDASEAQKMNPEDECTSDCDEGHTLFRGCKKLPFPLTELQARETESFKAMLQDKL